MNLKMKFIRWILRNFYSDWSIAWGVYSTDSMALGVQNTKHSFLYENCMIERDVETLFGVDSPPDGVKTTGLVTRCTFKLTEKKDMVDFEMSYDGNPNIDWVKELSKGYEPKIPTSDRIFCGCGRTTILKADVPGWGKTSNLKCNYCDQPQSSKESAKK